MQGWLDDLRLAQQIQESLQGCTPPSLPGVRLAGASLPVRSLGGDYYDFLARDDRVRVLIADVMGKGVGAAMQMVMTRTAAHLASAECASPGLLLQRLNHVLYPDLMRLGSFVTMFCAEFIPAQGTLICANAGHPAPLLQRGPTTETLAVRGVAIGAVPAAHYPEITLDLRPEDTVLFFTDGAAEATAPADRRLRTEGLARLLQAHRGIPTEQLPKRLLTDLVHLAGPERQRDDITLALLQVTHPPGAVPA